MKRKRSTPRAVSSATASATSASLVSVQPASETLPSRASTETTIRSPCASTVSPRNSGSRSAAVPITTRSAPASQRGGDRVGVAQPAADLDRAVDRVGDPPHRLEVLRLARLRPVEVDDVQVLGAFLGPARRGVDRVGVVGGLAVVVALEQAHGVAAADVDRRVEDHAAARRDCAQIPAKLASRRRPAALDFSGWNWTPKTLSRSAAQAKRAP